MAYMKKGDIIGGGFCKVTRVYKTPKKDMMSASNPFGLLKPYRYDYVYIKGPLKGTKASAGCDGIRK